MPSPRPLFSSALALFGLVATLGFTRSASALTVSTKQTFGADLLLDELVVEAGGIVEVVPLRSEGGTGTLRIRARKITVKSGGVITATSAGYLGVNGADGSAAPGSNGGGKRSTIAGHPGGGGGYMAAGASGASEACAAFPDAPGGAAGAMPSMTTPILGNAGGAANVTSIASAGGDGGGVIILEAAEIVIDGTVEARGGSPAQVSGVARGGGSGGFIAISAAHVSGSGVISVVGGQGSTAPGTGPILANNGGGGAGGVILIKAGDVAQSLQDRLEAQGGASGSCAALDATKGTTSVDVADPMFCVDADADGEPSDACGGLDCDDSVKAIHPGADEVCNDADDDCDGDKDEGDKLCPVGRTCDSAAKMCIDISDAGSDGGPTVDPGAPPDYIAFESGCALRGGSDGPGALALVALGLGALVARRRRGSRREEACK